MLEWTIFVFCGLTLALAALLVVQDFFCFCWINILLAHPWDYVAHFVVSFTGVVFFSIFFCKIFHWGHGTPLVLSAIIMLAVGFLKEIFIDPYISMEDIGWNFVGVFLAFFILI